MEPAAPYPNGTGTSELPALSESSFLTLLSLSEGPLHGYAIMAKVRELSAGRIELSSGTLYTALRRFVAAGWIERTEGAGAEESAERRKEYRLCPRGKTCLEDEVARMRSLLKAAEGRFESPSLRPA